jgi:hypothetical protein
MLKKNIFALIGNIIVVFVLAFSVVGCGYKAPPKYVESNK